MTDVATERSQGKIFALLAAEHGQHQMNTHLWRPRLRRLVRRKGGITIKDVCRYMDWG